MGGASQSQGDVEYIYCPDPEKYDGFIIVGEIVGREEGVETGLSGHFPLSALSDIVKWGSAKTPLAIYCHFGVSSNPQNFNVYKKAVIFDDRARITSTDIEDMGSLEESARIGQSASISAAGYYEVVPLNYIARVDNLIVDTGHGCAIDRLYDDSLPIDNRYAFYVVAHNTGTPSATQEFIYSVDGGQNWGEIDFSSVAGGNTLDGIAVINGVPVIISKTVTSTFYVDVLSGDVTPTVVAGTVAWNCISSVGNAAYVGGFSGDFGIIEDYTSVPVEMTIGSSADVVSVHALPGGIILAGDAAGKVFYSTDGINFGSANPGGGSDAITAVCAVNDSVFWAGDAAGKLFYSTNSGQTWSERGFPGSDSGVVTGIVFPTLSVGFISHNPGAGTQAVLLKTTGAGTVGSWVKVPVAGALPSADNLLIAGVRDNPNLLLGTGALDQAETDGVIMLGLPS
ncbi:MAG: hypothetical protein DRI46_07855 [Chloroflexi bacterium]|nr:MAG: hypothetical protein DRI46_07855 [Chloroflexota bacterium]